jgi:hypothetical protein
MKRVYGEERWGMCPLAEWYDGEGEKKTLKKGWEPFLDAVRDWEGAMEVKYLSAATHPWDPVAPDPPKPDPRTYLGETGDLGGLQGQTELEFTSRGARKSDRL